MCGIFGVVSSDPALCHYARTQLETIAHRGPDEQGSWNSRTGVYLGIRRLSIIDLAGGQQPIFNEDGTCCIVYNGELYNFLDLRPELEAKGHVFKTRSDTEVILHAYEEWGFQCLKRLNGMFGFAIWDDRQKLLFVARDRIGEKPLYYYSDKDRFIFGSEIKAIVSDPSIDRAVHLPGLANFLSFSHAVAPQTMYRNILKLLPGHYLTVHNQRVNLVQYWDVGDEPQTADEELGPAEWAERIRALLEDAVRRRMIADVPLGAFLSGGLDSSAVVALMKKYATGPVKTFSLGFTIGGAYNELSDARIVADHLNTEHHELNVEHVELIDTLQKLVYHFDEPFGDAANFPVFLLSKFAREHVKVVLTGEGGDELFGGYRRYAADQFASPYQKLPSMLRTMIPWSVNSIPRLRRIKRTVRSLAVADPADRHASWLWVFRPDMQAKLLRPDILEQIADYNPAERLHHYYNSSGNGVARDHLNRLLYIDVKTWLPDAFMEKVDKATMACSLEARSPILDHRLVELAFQIPGKYKISGWSTKLILKEAVRDLLPPSVLKKRKHGFAVPTNNWFRKELKDFVFEIILDQRARRRGYFNFSYIEELYRAHRDGKEVYSEPLWLLVNFELWNQIYMDGSPS